MKPFRFTLEAVSIVRQRQEQKAMELYGQTLDMRRQAKDALDAVDKELNTCWQQWRRQLADGFAAADAARAHAYHSVLTQRRTDCAKALEAAERRVNAALEDMLQARQQREIVDKFFDKQKAQHQRGVARGEQKFLDDLAGRRRGSILAWRSADNPI